jgi:hypothetical protein
MNPSNDPKIPFAPAGGTGSGGGITEGSTLTEAKHNLAAKARETASKVKSAAADTAARAKDQAQHVATEKKEAAANRIGSYGSAIHESARSLEEQDPNIAWFTHRAAERIENVANYVRTRDFAGLREDAENVARRHPAAFFGGMFIAGLVLGNIMKASRRNLDEDESFANGGDPSDWTEDSTASLGVELPTAASGNI